MGAKTMETEVSFILAFMPTTRGIPEAMISRILVFMWSSPRNLIEKPLAAYRALKKGFLIRFSRFYMPPPSTS